MDKKDVLASIREIKYPAGFGESALILENVIPDLQYKAAYPSFRHTNPEVWEREDRVVLVTPRLLLLCEARSGGFEFSDYMGSSRRSHEWFTTSVRTAALAEIDALRIETQQGPVSVRSTSHKMVNVTLSHARSGIDLVLPLADDLRGGDQNDIEALYKRLEEFADSLLSAVNAACT